VSKKARRTPSSHAFDISDKRDLIFHTYDMFLTTQTRLFTLSRFVYELRSFELDEMQTMLFLDDIVQFAIASRRLIELTSLKSFSNQRAIPLQYFDYAESPPKMRSSESKIGFLTVINNFIHAKYIELFRHRYEYRLYVKELRDLDIYQIYEILTNISNDERWAEYAILPTVLFRSDKGELG
jgi:hypothetical protein